MINRNADSTPEEKVKKLINIKLSFDKFKNIMAEYKSAGTVNLTEMIQLNFTKMKNFSTDILQRLDEIQGKESKLKKPSLMEKY